MYWKEHDVYQARLARVQESPVQRNLPLGVRRKASCDIPAASRRNGRRNSWVICLWISFVRQGS